MDRSFLVIRAQRRGLTFLRRWPRRARTAAPSARDEIFSIRSVESAARVPLCTSVALRQAQSAADRTLRFPLTGLAVCPAFIITPRRTPAAPARGRRRLAGRGVRGNPHPWPHARWWRRRTRSRRRTARPRWATRSRRGRATRSAPPSGRRRGQTRRRRAATAGTRPSGGAWRSCTGSTRERRPRRAGGAARRCARCLYERARALSHHRRAAPRANGVAPGEWSAPAPLTHLTHLRPACAPHRRRARAAGRGSCVPRQRSSGLCGAARGQR